MTYLRDEILVAYADNQLSTETRRAVEHMLAVDPEARHTVALFKLSSCQVRQCLDALDFGSIPTWFEALMSRTDAGGVRQWRRPAARGWLRVGLGAAFATCLILGIAVGHVAGVGPGPSGLSPGLAVLGTVPPTSSLADALHHIAQTGGAWTGPDHWRATEIAAFRDRFGNECREVELFSAPDGAVPAQVLIACRGAAEQWTVVGAVANEVTAASRDAYYVPTEREARSSLESILSMLGAQQRTSAAERKTMTP